MRNRFLVCYDVANPKRLKKMYKRMCGFGDPVQLSVFLCRLSAKEKVLMLQAITALIHHEADRVMIIDLGPAEGRGEECIEFCGRRDVVPQTGAVVV